jgi:hypothetical protein
LNFFIEWFDSNLKEKFKIYLKFLGKTGKKRKRKNFFHSIWLSARRPSS